MGYHFSSMNYCITSESNCLYQFESYIERLSCINIFCSLWIENRLETWNSILRFRQIPQQVSLRSFHCDNFFSYSEKVWILVYSSAYRE